MVRRTEKGVRRTEKRVRRTEKGVRRTEKGVQRTEIVLWGHRRNEYFNVSTDCNLHGAEHLTL